MLLVFVALHTEKSVRHAVQGSAKRDFSEPETVKIDPLKNRVLAYDVLPFEISDLGGSLRGKNLVTTSH